MAFLLRLGCACGLVPLALPDSARAHAAHHKLDDSMRLFGHPDQCAPCTLRVLDGGKIQLGIGAAPGWRWDRFEASYQVL